MELFCVPQAGWTMKSATLSAWLKKEGEPVREGEPILVMETDKALVEVEATSSGIVARILLPAGGSAWLASRCGFDGLLLAAVRARDRDDFNYRGCRHLDRSTFCSIS